MSDSKPPKPSQPKFLPRTWKAPEEPAEEPKPEPAKKKGKGTGAKGGKDKDAKAKASKKAKQTDDGDVLANGSKLEETPLLDTYEARQKIRYVIGGVLSLVAFILIMVVVRMFQPAAAKVDPDAERREARPVAVDTKESNEREAGVLVENAKKADREGQDKNAVVLLTKVIRGYDGTDAAKEAKAALARESQNRPLFGPDPTKPTGPVAPVQPASPGAVATAPGATPPPVVVAVAPVAPPPPPRPKPPEIVARPLPNGFRIEPGAALHSSGWPLRITCDRDKAPMVFIPAGEFLMGREDGERQERPSHRVKLAAYYIDEHEVTNRQYQAYLEETGRAADLARAIAAPNEAPKPFPPEKLDLPVAGLTAREAQAYCYWANRRLPSEAQWELAARSTDGRVAFPIPRDPKGEARSLDPVMANPGDRSPLGGYDFAGNAWEWTADYYDSSYYNSLKDLTLDPTGPAQSRIKPAQAAIKGGSPVGSLTWRQGMAVDKHLPLLGFRGALPVEAQATAAGAASPGSPAPPPAGGMPF